MITVFTAGSFQQVYAFCVAEPSCIVEGRLSSLVCFVYVYSRGTQQQFYTPYSIMP